VDTYVLIASLFFRIFDRSYFKPYRRQKRRRGLWSLLLNCDSIILLRFVKKFKWIPEI
jgi:hypothetical protein